LILPGGDRGELRFQHRELRSLHVDKPGILKPADLLPLLFDQPLQLLAFGLELEGFVDPLDRPRQRGDDVRAPFPLLQTHRP
jgi:hypothetical protein